MSIVLSLNHDRCMMLLWNINLTDYNLEFKRVLLPTNNCSLFRPWKAYIWLPLKLYIAIQRNWKCIETALIFSLKDWFPQVIYIIFLLNGLLYCMLMNIFMSIIRQRPQRAHFTSYSPFGPIPHTMPWKYWVFIYLLGLPWWLRQ